MFIVCCIVDNDGGRRWRSVDGKGGPGPDEKVSISIRSGTMFSLDGDGFGVRFLSLLITHLVNRRHADNRAICGRLLCNCTLQWQSSLKTIEHIRDHQNPEVVRSVIFGLFPPFPLNY